MFIMSSVLLDFTTDTKLFMRAKRKWALNQTELLLKLLDILMMIYLI